MASIIRSAKSGKHWTLHELVAFNINVVQVDFQKFFGVNQLPSPNVPDIILNNEKLPDELQNIPKHHPQRQAYQFYSLLTDATSPILGRDSAVADFTAFLLALLDFDEGPRVIHTYREINFVMCGQTADARTDVCVMQRVHDALMYLLVVQENKNYISTNDAEAQLIAQACAAFHENNRLRVESGLPPLASMVFPGIIFLGSRPVFYKIPVTNDLLLALATAQYPAAPTIVEKLVPPFPDIESSSRTGMQEPVNRAVVFQCLQAFKTLVHNLDT